jgi:hypothetical protein
LFFEIKDLEAILPALQAAKPFKMKYLAKALHVAPEPRNQFPPR